MAVSAEGGGRGKEDDRKKGVSFFPYIVPSMDPCNNP
jgi:hypothetical protein